MTSATLRRVITALGLAVVVLAASIGTPGVRAAPGDLIATVTLDMPGGTSVGGTFDGTHYISVRFGDTTLFFMTPPPGNGLATLAFSKPIVDAADGVSPVSVSAVAWDPSRNALWGAAANTIWLIDISGASALAAVQFNPNVGGSSLVDGLAWDSNDDTLWYSPDVNLNVYQFSLGTGGNPPLGTLLNTVAPKNASGAADGRVSGVVVGSANSLYIGRDGAAEIRRIDKTTGDFISQFATTSGRVEDLTCDPITYAPKEAVLAKDAFNVLYEAFEVEAGTCPLPGEEPTPTPTPTATPPPDEQINIHVNKLSTGAKQDGTCWRISFGPAKVQHDVVGDDTGGVKPDCGEPSNLKLFDEDPAPGVLLITITSAQRVQFGNIWHVQNSFSPVGKPDPNNYECDLSQGKCTIPKTAVGGLSVDLAGDETGLPLEAAQSSGGNAGVVATVIAALTAGAIALGGVAWYVRRRLIS